MSTHSAIFVIASLLQIYARPSEPTMNKQIVGSLHRLQALACHFPSLSNSVCLVRPNPLTTAPSAWSSLDCMALYPPPFNPNLTFCLPELASICVSCNPLSEDEATISGGTAIRPCESPPFTVHNSRLFVCYASFFECKFRGSSDRR